MKKIEAYTFSEVLEIIEKFDTYRGFEYIISKDIFIFGNEHKAEISIKHIKKDYINWEDLQKDLFIKIK